MVRARKNFDRLPWEDRFNPPAEADLREGLPEESIPLFDETVRAFSEVTGDGGRVVWNGECWKWTLEYRIGRGGDLLAVVIPNPQDFQVAMPVEAAFVRSVWSRRMKRAVRDGLELAAEPYDSDWSVWSITSQSLLSEVLTLVRKKLEFPGQIESG